MARFVIAVNPIVHPPEGGAASEENGDSSDVDQRYIKTMIALHPQYVTDEKGARLAVVISVAEFDQILEELEMIDDVAAYDRAKLAGGEPMALDAFLASLDAR